jgi:hypothetical protein
VIRGLHNVKRAGFQLFSGQDEAQQYTKKNYIEIRERWGWLTGTTIIDCNCNVWRVG